MLLTVVIPTFKRPQTLGVCLQHLAPERQNVSPDTYEVIVTDDAPGDEQRDSLRRDFPWVIHNRAPQKGPAANRNSGARAARGDWLIFLDDDCIPQRSFLSAYIEAIKQHPDYVVFEGSTLEERPRIRMDEEAPLNAKGGYLWSCNFMIKRQVFFDLDGFCELYPYACMEDVDFREQLKEKRIEFLFLPKASVIHPWKNLAADDKYLKTSLISHAIFFERYPQLRPSLYRTCRVILRGWMAGLLMEAPRLKFRGFGRYLARQSTQTLFQIRNWSGVARKEPRP